MTPKKINLSYTAEDGSTHSREYTDLSQVWHPASEPPKPNKDIIVAAYNEDRNRRDIWCMALHSSDWTPSLGTSICLRCGPKKTNKAWAYLDDLLPPAKVFGKSEQPIEKIE